MTELEFWAALVSDYPQTAQRLPTLTANKIRGGVPPPLRGVVWPSIAGARDNHLHEEFQRLSGMTSPFEALIGKDVGRSFPNVEMFREKDGEGQTWLSEVLKCFSLYDEQIGYCQGTWLRCRAFTHAHGATCGICCSGPTHGRLQSTGVLPARSCWTSCSHLSIPTAIDTTSTATISTF